VGAELATDGALKLKTGLVVSSAGLAGSACFAAAPKAKRGVVEEVVEGANELDVDVDGVELEPKENNDEAAAVEAGLTDSSVGCLEPN